MRTLDRYISGAFLKSFLMAVFALTTIFFFQALLSELTDLDYPAQQLLARALMNLPQVMVQMVPSAVLLSTVMTLSSLSRTSELVACYAIGVGLNRIMGVILSVVFMISCLSVVLQDRIVPPLFKKRTTYYWREMRKRPDFFLDVKQDKIWYRSRNLIYNLRSFDAKSRTIYGMSVYTFDDRFRLIELLDAKKGIYTRNGWSLVDGTVTVFSPDDPFPLTKPFESKELLISETPQDFQEIEKEVDGLRFRELYSYIQHVKATGTDTKGFEVKFHSRISLCFVPIVMCVLGVPFATRGRREGGMARDLGLCLAITFFYWLFYQVGLSLGTNGALPPWLAAWLPSMIFMALAATLITRRPT